MVPFAKGVDGVFISVLKLAPQGYVLLTSKVFVRPRPYLACIVLDAYKVKVMLLRVVNQGKGVARAFRRGEWNHGVKLEDHLVNSLRFPSL